MKNLIKSQFYQLRKESMSVTFFVVILFMELVVSIDIDFGTTASSFLAECGHYMVLVAAAFSLMFTAQVCGSGFLDKTVNYEMMGGYRRRQVYFSKALVSLLIGMAGAILAFLAPFMTVVLRLGWGTDLDVKGTVVRYLLLIFPLFRMICEFIFLSFLIKNAYVVMALGFFVPVGLGTSIMEFFPECKSVLLGLSNIYHLAVFPDRQLYRMIDLKVIDVYDSFLSPTYILLTILGSLVIGIFFLWLGYQYFEKDDLR